MDKEIERLKSLCAKFSNTDDYVNAEWLGISNILAIETLLQDHDRLQTENKKLKNTIENKTKELKKPKKYYLGIENYLIRELEEILKVLEE